jgi:hypothetical protein
MKSKHNYKAFKDHTNQFHRFLFHGLIYDSTALILAVLCFQTWKI